jgi:hypothetical protein
MDQPALITDALGRGRGVMRRAIAGRSPDDLAYRPDRGANPLGWLAWHVGRVEDMHVADLMEADQLWTADGWHERFGMPPEPEVYGTGQRLEEVDAVTVPTPRRRSPTWRRSGRVPMSTCPVSARTTWIACSTSPSSRRCRRSACGW